VVKLLPSPVGRKRRIGNWEQGAIVLDQVYGGKPNLSLETSVWLLRLKYRSLEERKERWEKKGKTNTSLESQTDRLKGESTTVLLVGVFKHRGWREGGGGSTL